MSRHGRTDLTFEPDPDHSLDAGTGLLSPISYRLRKFAALPRLPVSQLRCYAEFYIGGKSHVYATRVSHGCKMDDITGYYEKSYYQ